MACHEALVRSHARVEALTEVSSRFGAITAGLLDALYRAVPELEGEARDQARAAYEDAAAQIEALASTVEAAAADLG